MALFSIEPSFPHSSLLELPPSQFPEVVLPPESTPFQISLGIYQELLSVKYPITIAIIYAITVNLLNRLNKSRGNKPWAFSKSRLFIGAVVLHNISLAVYSAWTFVGMWNAIAHTFPGWHGEGGIAGAVDSLCKINGPRGFGNAVFYNNTKGAWTTYSRSIYLTNAGLPDSDDLGRLWNEGLAFYGWLFYVSKFYEVLDTAIILAKGKKSSLLQTYHHAGAMMCMWAGIRYMAPPIWMFVFINSGIHTLMYTYYTLSALSISVPQAIKKTITTLQIAQFLFGASYAAAHLFISYKIPVSVPYTLVSHLSSTASTASSAATSIARAAATAGVGGWLKKMAFRAVGEEGLAENVAGGQIPPSNVVVVGAIENRVKELRYRTEYQTVPCIDTSGEVFAILLNVVYLAPLTWLFVKFFIRSYISRASSRPHESHERRLAHKAVSDALKGITREAMDAPSPKANEAAPRKY
ncbi:MAG: hypothetical protein M1829_006731 [Trizodia sp. TS-e1964]|nr:MAG: hypothetical protein M1829_006731 [Trizodia sp. TS-e1964]